MSSSTSTQHFPELPTELILYILSFACHTSHETALNVSLVSSWVRSTVLPYVFSTIVRRAGPSAFMAPWQVFARTAPPTTLPSSYSLKDIGQLTGQRLQAPVPATSQPPPTGGFPLASAGRLSANEPPFSQARFIRPGSASQLSYAHLLPPTTRDVGQYVRHLWIESIDMMSSPGELNIFDACTNIEDVALAAGSLRVLYNLTKFGRNKNRASGGGNGGQGQSQSQGQGSSAEDAEEGATETPPSTVGAASRIRSVLLTKHTFRYDWHFLVAIDSVADTHTSLLGNITHLRLTDMEKSPYIPLEYLPNLTHLALPYLQLRANHGGDTLRIPELVLQPDRPTVVGAVGRQQAQWGEAPWAAERNTTRSKLEVVVLTVDERVWLTKPWKYGAHVSNDSPRQLFKDLRRQARARDARIRVVLSPRLGQGYCSEWADAGRGISSSIWEVAERTHIREDYGDDLPEVFPRLTA